MCLCVGHPKTGGVPTGEGATTQYDVQQLPGIELLGVMCTDKTWNAEEGKCDCACTGYVRSDGEFEWGPVLCGLCACDVFEREVACVT